MSIQETQSGGQVVLNFLKRPAFLQSRDTENDLRLIVSRYRSSEKTPDLIYQTWRDLWTVLGLPHGFQIEVPYCPYSEKEIRVQNKYNRIIIYQPEEFANISIDAINRLSLLFPHSSDALARIRKGDFVENIHHQSGWLDLGLSFGRPDDEQGITINTLLTAAMAWNVIYGTPIGKTKFDNPYSYVWVNGTTLAESGKPLAATICGGDVNWIFTNTNDFIRDYGSLIEKDLTVGFPSS